MHVWTIDDICSHMSYIEGGLLRKIRPTSDAGLQLFSNFMQITISIAQRLFPPLQVRSDLMVEIDDFAGVLLPYTRKLELASSQDRDLHSGK